MNDKIVPVDKADYVSITLHKEEWEYVLAACEQMSCGYERTEYLTHCCDLNDVVPLLREKLNVLAEDE